MTVTERAWMLDVSLETRTEMEQRENTGNALFVIIIFINQYLQNYIQSFFYT